MYMHQKLNKQPTTASTNLQELNHTKTFYCLYKRTTTTTKNQLLLKAEQIFTTKCQYR